ncbi:MAG TPA: hypothetical protein VN653_15905 [Anaerolineales bacterium]|nr:hypothetical protein [Anaerolineales bacterium]
MDSSRIKNEGWLYWLAFLIAIALRFIQLGAAPLTDSEARLALQAFHLSQGQSLLLAPQAAYILFTGILFAVIESTNFMARLIPALAGSALVFAPYFFRNKLKPRPAVILAFLFAIDPGLVALSRQSGGTMLAVTFLLFAWGMWLDRRVTAAGIFLGIALLSGPSIWSGLLTIGLTWSFLRFVQPRPAPDSELTNTTSDSQVSNVDSAEYISPSRNTLIPLLATVLLGGTLFFTTPNGLSAALASIPAYLTGWVSSSTMTTGRVLLAFVVYELLGISLAALAIIRGFRTNSKRIIRLSLWLGVALILAVFYRQTDELGWAIIPLLVLAASELSHAIDMYRDEFVEVGVVVIAIFVLLAYIWFNISNIALNPYQVPTTVPIFGVVNNPRYFVLFGSLAILLVSVGLVAFGWSARTARLGVTWSSVIFFGLYSIGTAWGASGLRDPGGVELWIPDSRPLQADLLRASVDEVSDFSLGHISAQPVTIFGISSPALEWLLRNNAVTVVSTLDPQVAPPIVITPVMNDLGLPSAYRGQDFIWRQTPQWATTQSPDWVKWFVFRQLPVENETIILWARDNLFPDARQNPTP